VKHTKINPWTYPGSIDAGVMVEGPRRILFVNGQCAVSADGQPMHAGNMRAQALAAIDNIEVVLKEAGMSLANIVRMNTYVTDVDAYFADAHEAVTQRLEWFDVSPPGVLAGISRLGLPELLVELEAFAAD
jgi:2-iminobutanoate/2-iminopropanoate deaminase